MVGTHLAWHSLALGLGLRDPKARADASAKQVEHPSRRWDTLAQAVFFRSLTDIPRKTEIDALDIELCQPYLSTPVPNGDDHL